ncbi:MAG: pyruvoyl-dependent arginine decarboxylase [Bacteroidota bacterium]
MGFEEMKDRSSNYLPSSQACEAEIPFEGLVIGNRIPKDYFITSGVGESDITIHAGSYHLALKDAGIEMANIMTYSSILPGIANQVSRPARIVHGEVMETIMAVAHGSSGELVSAGIVYSWLYNRKTGEKYGGLVCEHNGNYSEEELDKRLHASLNELYINGFREDYTLGEPNMIKKSFIPHKAYGTALVAICFTNFLIPLIQG